MTARPLGCIHCSTLTAWQSMVAFGTQHRDFNDLAPATDGTYTHKDIHPQDPVIIMTEIYDSSDLGSSFHYICNRVMW
jgi:hypothetical protein